MLRSFLGSSRALPLILGAFGLVAAFVLPAAAQAPTVELDSIEEDDFFVRMGEYFEAHPELKTQRSTGWKPYNRMKWFYDQRVVRGRPSTGADLWRAWEEKQAILASSPRSGGAWFELGPTNLSGRILAIAFDPNDADNVYVGAASGGLWKTTNGGDTWITTTDELPAIAIGGVVVHPFDSNVVLIATGEGTPNFGRVTGVGILKSTDAGLTWAQTSLTYAVNSGTAFHFMEANPFTGTILAGGNDGLWRSTDEGETWTEVNGSASYWDAKWKPGDPDRVYVTRGGAFGPCNIRVSTNDGLTWSTLSSGLPTASSLGKSKLAVSAADPSVVYAHLTSSSNYSTVGIYRSTNDGATWSARNTSTNMAGGQGWYNASIAVDPDDIDRVIAGGVRCYGSSNGGTTFGIIGDGYGLGTETALHWDHHAVAYEPGSNSNVWVGTDGGVWKSTDDGASWASRREGMGTYQFYDICVAQSDPDVTLGGTQDNGVPVRDGLDTWLTSNLFADGMVCNISPFDATLVYAESQNGGHVRSTDGGGSWADADNGISGSGAWVTPVDMDPSSDVRLYTESSTGIWRTNSGGNNWQNIGGHSARWIAVSDANTDYVWTVESNQLPRWSTDRGNNWTIATTYGFDRGNEEKVYPHPTEPSTAFVTFTSFDPTDALVARTTTMGASWTDVTGDLPAQPVNTIVIDSQNPTEWYIGTDTGVWTTTNGGVNWVPFGTSFPNTVVWDLEIRTAARKLVAGTHGRGAWEIPITGGATGVDVATGVATPHLMLDPPTPNPVGATTVLRFAARHEGPVSLMVYDVRGRVVSRLAELERGDGVVRRAPWLTDDTPSGVYFAVLSDGTRSVSRKLVVRK